MKNAIAVALESKMHTTKILAWLPHTKAIKKYTSLLLRVLNDRQSNNRSTCICSTPN